MRSVLVFDYSGTIVHDRYGAGFIPSEGALEVIPKLSQTYRLAVNTSLSDASITEKVRKLGLDSSFSLLLGSDSGDKLSNLRLIAQQFTVDAKDMIMIGDMERDYQAAKEFGCEFIGMNYEGSENVHTVRDFFALEKLLTH